MTGAWLSFFTSCVVFNHVIQSSVTFFDLICVVAFAPLLISSFVESNLLKWFQVAVILISGSAIVAIDPPSQPAGFVIMAFAPMFTNTYGLLEKHLTIKLTILAAVYLALFAISLQNPVSAIMWLMMCITINAGIWVNVSHLIEKARRLDEIAMRTLEQNLVTNEALLEETVKAGMVLVKEIKSKDVHHGCEE